VCEKGETVVKNVKEKGVERGKDASSTACAEVGTLLRFREAKTTRGSINKKNECVFFFVGGTKKKRVGEGKKHRTSVVSPKRKMLKKVEGKRQLGASWRGRNYS